MSISVVGARETFGSYLRELRKLKGVKSPAELAQRMDGKVSVSGILKRERGELKITADYLENFIKAVGVSPQEEKHLRQHLSLFRLQFDIWSAGKTVLDINVEAAARLEESKYIQSFSPTLIPHIIQTPGYARAILESSHSCENLEELEKTLRVRQQNAERILQQRHRKIELVNWEAALYNIYGGVTGMLDQMFRLLEILEQEPLQYRIVPMAEAANLAIVGTFTIHDRLFVTSEGAIGNLYTGDKNKADWVAKHFDQLWAVAASGKSCREIIEKAIAFLEDSCSKSIAERSSPSI